MTLIVSVLVEDGIVWAGDSVSTLKANTAQETPEPTPINTFPHSQKIFPFYKRFGIGIWTQDSINGKPVDLVMRGLEDKFGAEGKSFNTVEEVALTISEEFHSIKREKESIGFIVAGYTECGPEVIKVSSVNDVGPYVGIEEYCPLTHTSDELGCQSLGETRLEDLIKKLHGERGDPDSPPFGLFSLQTAIDYGLFLIRTTIEFERFSRRESTVAKAIDVAVVTQLKGFRWVERFPMAAIL